MGMREDMAKVTTEVRKICRGTVEVTQAHWEEAKKKGHETEAAQISYLKLEAQAGVQTGCKEPCRWGAAASFNRNAQGAATITAMCNRDPRTKW